MSDRALIAMQKSIQNLTRRIADLERNTRFDVGKDWMSAGWWGFCSPTQPASRIVNVHGGTFWLWTAVMYTGHMRKMDNVPYDFSLCGVFAAQYHYRWGVIQADVSDDPVTLRFHDDGTEFGTAAECEADFWATGPATNLYGDYIPLAVVVLRNEGTLATVGAIENVTLADTTKSYFLLRDCRPWIHLHVEPPD